MDSTSGGGPKFPGELADHLPQQDEKPNRWTDRLKHAWFLYVLLAVAIPAWIGAMVAAIVYLGALGWFLALMILVAPGAVYVRFLQWRLLTGRDLDTGERLDRRDR